DQSYTTLDGKGKETNILNGYSGVTAASIGSGIGNWMASAKTEGFSLEGAPVPVPEKGRRAKFGVYQPRVTPSARSFDAISTSCKNVDAAIKYLDYGYSDEGRMLYNFGIEGESYEMKDGYPTYTELITNNPEGRSMTVALSNYARSYDAGPFVQDRRYMEQYAKLPQQKRAWETWSNTDAPIHTLPNLYVKSEELNEYAQLNNDIDTYVDEMIMKFIIGAESLENYDQMIQQLHTRGIDRLLEIRQSAYDRYLNK
ncbi:MAG: ABC transporter substrate-binding protein, partial [Clostridia bacterium]|nr:ABC transporter substrate-binding protein [Clostridia bacterium]